MALPLRLTHISPTALIASSPLSRALPSVVSWLPDAGPKALLFPPVVRTIQDADRIRAQLRASSPRLRCDLRWPIHPDEFLSPATKPKQTTKQTKKKIRRA